MPLTQFDQQFVPWLVLDAGQRLKCQIACRLKAGFGQMRALGGTSYLQAVEKEQRPRPHS